jgi:hypothetical protein
MNFGAAPFAFDVLDFEVRENVGYLDNPLRSIEIMNLRYLEEILRYDDAIKRCHIRNALNLRRHPILSGSSRYSVAALQMSSLFLSRRIERNTCFLLNLAYGEHLKLNEYVDVNGNSLDKRVFELEVNDADDDHGVKWDDGDILDDDEDDDDEFDDDMDEDWFELGPDDSDMEISLS